MFSFYPFLYVCAASEATLNSSPNSPSLTCLHPHLPKQDICPYPKLSLPKTELMPVSPGQPPRPCLPSLSGLQLSSHCAGLETPGFSLIFFSPGQLKYSETNIVLTVFRHPFRVYGLSYSPIHYHCVHSGGDE